MRDRKAAGNQVQQVTVAKSR